MQNFKSQAFGTDEVIVANLIPGSATDLDATQNLQFSTDNLSGKIGLDFKTAAGTLLYANYSRGYRGGSFNGQAYFSPEELSITKPEKVTAYEIGSKASLLDRRLQINGAVFYYDYRNQQFIDVDPDTGAQPLVNLPKSRIYGGELEIVARPVHSVTLTGGIGLLNTRVLEGTLGGQDISGNEIVSAPKFSQTLAIDWDILTASWGSLAARVDGSYAAKRYFDLQNRPSTTQDAYGLLNARLGWKSASGKASIDLWARNLTNTFYASDRIDVSSGFGFIYNRIGEPRTYGATFGFSF
jgi:iron complex outermembrane receptor protein